MIARILQCDGCHESVARGAQPRDSGTATRRVDARGSILRLRLGVRVHSGGRRYPLSADLCAGCRSSGVPLAMASRAAEQAERYGSTFEAAARA